MLPTFDPWLSASIAADVALCTYLPVQRLAAVRARRLALLLRASAQKSPLYRRVLRGRDPEIWRLEDLPILSRAELMHSFQQWVGDGEIRLEALRQFTAAHDLIAEPFLGRYTVWESSGSGGGEHGIFVQDVAAMAVYDALEAVRRIALRPGVRLVDPFYLGERVVFLGATSGHFASAVSLERIRRLNPLLAPRLRSVSILQALDKQIAELHAFQPTIVATYPSVAVLLAEEHHAGRLGIAPQEIWTGGETLTANMRAMIEKAFKCPVVNSYGASEFLTLASQCHCGALHLNCDWAILESIDEDGRLLPTGTAGASVLLTNLANHVQPLIRYDLTDSVTLHSGSCACGSSLPIIEVQGRRDDMLRLMGDSDQSVRLVPLALTTVLEEEAGLFDFQIVQQGPRDVALYSGLRGESAAAALTRAKAALGAYLSRQGAHHVRIHCYRSAPAKLASSGKMRRVIGMPCSP